MHVWHFWNQYLYPLRRKRTSFIRLEEELLRQLPPDESIFAWRSPENLKNPKGTEVTSCGLLAPWPTCYLKSGNLTIQSRKHAPRQGLEAFKPVGGGIELRAPNKLPARADMTDFIRIGAFLRRNYWLKLNCWDAEAHNRNTITINLRKKKGSWRRIHCERWSHSLSPRSSHNLLGPKTSLIEVFQRVQEEEDWGHMMAREQRV